MESDSDTTIPINLIRPKLTPSCSYTPPPEVDVELVAAIRLEGDANFYAGLSDNEPVGVFIPTYRPYPVGTAVAIGLEVPGRTELIITSAVVRWHRVESERSDYPPGIGLEFTALSRKARTAINRFAGIRAPLLHDE